MSRRVVVNADDFGLTLGVNRGIIEAYDRGIVTSASLMVRWPAARDAVELAKARPKLSVGLHVDLGEWVHSEGEWQPLYDVVDTDDARAVDAEVARQVACFTELLGQPPTHLDSHQHVHRNGSVADAVQRVALQLGIPVRDQTVPYVGSFYGQLGTGEPCREILSVEGLTTIVASLPLGPSELGCHPGYADGLAILGTMYVDERELELQVLCDPAARAALDDLAVELCSFRDVVRP